MPSLPRHRVGHLEQRLADVAAGVEQFERLDDMFETLDDGLAIRELAFGEEASEVLGRFAEAVGVVDALNAEDVGKFPDKNLAEALQRVPGVTIERSGGEGRRVSIRGLSSDLTLTELNGNFIASADSEAASQSSACAASKISSAPAESVSSSLGGSPGSASAGIASTSASRSSPLPLVHSP